MFLVILLILLEGVLCTIQPIVLLNLPACTLALIAMIVAFEAMKRSKLARLKSKQMLSEMLKPTYFNKKLTWSIDDALVDQFSNATREVAVSAVVGLAVSFVGMEMSRRVYRTFSEPWHDAMSEQATMLMLGFIFTMIIFFALAAQVLNPFSVFKEKTKKAVDDALKEAEGAFSEKLEKLTKSTDDVAKEAAAFGVIFRSAYDAEIVAFVKKYGKELYIRQSEFISLMDKVADSAEDDLEKLIKVKRRYDAAQDLFKSVEALVRKSGTLSHVKQLESIDQIMHSEKLRGFLPAKEWKDFASSLKDLADGLKALREDVKNPKAPEKSEIPKRKFPKFGR